MTDPVEHPSHYTFGTIEVIDVIEDWKLDFVTGSILKYLARAGKKSTTTELEDLRKAQWLLNRRIVNLTKIPPGTVFEMEHVAAHESFLDIHKRWQPKEQWPCRDWGQNKWPGDWLIN
jgi:hypothetical protein